MRWGRRAAALTAVAAVLGVRTAAAQSVTVSVATVNDSISPAPPILVQGSAGPAELGPYSISLEVAFEPLFTAPILARATPSLRLAVQLDSLLPEHSRVYFRGRIFNRLGQVQEDVRSFPVRSWLRLVSPTRSSNDVLFTRQPRFVWSSPGITLPPGPWQYDLAIINSRDGAIAFEFHQVNTTPIGLDSLAFTLPSALEACTSYRWRVTARAINGAAKDQITVASPGTFVVQSKECPTATIFYQNFPNPFGRGTMSATTCFWFDLAREATVKLTIYDVRLRVVRSILAGAGSNRLPAGPYGRQGGAEGGCDEKFAWDGRDAGGRVVPAGVYIAAFEADGVRTTKKILFLGQ